MVCKALQVINLSYLRTAALTGEKPSAVAPEEQEKPLPHVPGKYDPRDGGDPPSGWREALGKGRRGS